MTNGNLMPGYRQVLGAGGMDSSRRIQNGRVGDCRKTGHSLMSLVSLVLLAIAVVLPKCSASDPCNNRIEVIDGWRDVSIADGKNKGMCDFDRFAPETWYSFSLSGKAAVIPTTCIKNNMCGSKVAMRVDLQGQSLPQNVGDNITAAMCGAYDVLGKFDCCVLRSVVYIARCPDDQLAYNFPSSFDRCPVAVCTQEQTAEVPAEAAAQMGEDVSGADSLSATGAATTDLNSLDTEVVTMDISSPDTLMGLGTSSESQPPQELSMQQTTISELSTQVDNTSNPHEAPDEAITIIANSTRIVISEIQSDSFASDLPTESDTLPWSTSNTTDLFAVTDDQHTQITLTDVSAEALFTDITTPSIESSSELITEQIDTLNVTSETVPDSSSTIELQSTSIEHSSNPTTTTNIYADESVSISNKILSDQLSTVTTPSEDNITVDNVTDVTEKPSTDLFSEPTSEAETKTDISTATSYTTNSTVAHTTPSSKTDLVDTATTKRASLDEISTPPRQSNATQMFTGSKTSIEKIRLVFKGNSSSLASPATVYSSLNSFLNEAIQRYESMGQYPWTQQLTSTSGAVDFEGRKTFMDFELVRSSNKLEDISEIFKQFDLKGYLFKHANVTLLDECLISEDCQFDRFEPVAQQSVFQSNAPAFITVIVLCSICLLVLVVALLYTHFSKRGSWKATSDIDVPENRHYISGNQSPFTDAQIMKDEMVDNASFNGSAKDGGDSNLHTTWVIPLDQDPDAPKTEVAITTEDTKF